MSEPSSGEPAGCKAILTDWRRRYPDPNMFETLSDRFDGIFSRLRGRGSLELELFELGACFRGRCGAESHLVLLLLSARLRLAAGGVVDALQCCCLLTLYSD